MGPPHGVNLGLMVSIVFLLFDSKRSHYTYLTAVEKDALTNPQTQQIEGAQCTWPPEKLTGNGIRPGDHYQC